MFSVQSALNKLGDHRTANESENKHASSMAKISSKLSVCHFFVSQWFKTLCLQFCQ